MSSGPTNVRGVWSPAIAELREGGLLFEIGVWSQSGARFVAQASHEQWTMKSSALQASRVRASIVCRYVGYIAFRGRPALTDVAEIRARGSQRAAPRAETQPGCNALQRPKKILAVASGGGHWVELRRVIKAFDGHKVTFVTVDPAYRQDVPGDAVRVVTDATRRNPCRVALLALQMLWVVLRIRPAVVISTGSAPGYFGIVFGRMLGARTIWLDSLANVDRLSMSGSLVRPFAGLCLTQWPHLAGRDGPDYAGQVL